MPKIPVPKKYEADRQEALRNLRRLIKDISNNSKIIANYDQRKMVMSLATAMNELFAVDIERNNSLGHIYNLCLVSAFIDELKGGDRLMTRRNSRQFSIEVYQNLQSRLASILASMTEPLPCDTCEHEATCPLDDCDRFEEKQEWPNDKPDIVH